MAFKFNRSINNTNNTDVADNDNDTEALEGTMTANKSMNIDEALKVAGIKDADLITELTLNLNVVDVDEPMEFNISFEENEYGPGYWRVIAGVEGATPLFFDKYTDVKAGLDALTKLVVNPFAILDDGAFLRHDPDDLDGRSIVQNVGYVSSEYRGSLDIVTPKRNNNRPTWASLEVRNGVITPSFTAIANNDNAPWIKNFLKNGKPGNRGKSNGIYNTMTVLNGILNQGAVSLRTGPAFQDLLAYYRKLWTLALKDMDLAKKVSRYHYNRGVAKKNLNDQVRMEHKVIEKEMAEEGGYTVVTEIAGINLIDGGSYQAGPKGSIERNEPLDSMTFKDGDDWCQSKARTWLRKVERNGWVVRAAEFPTTD